MIRPIVTVCMVLALQGCGALTNGTFTGSSTVLAPTKIIISSADQRLIIDRPYPNSNNSADGRVICAEPSPDIAKAFQAALQASGSAPSGPQGSIQFSSSEAITALAGRTPTVVALRDGLFRACEAFANGMIGKHSYALILSQYGDLLTTLMLGEAASTASSGGSSGASGATGTTGSGATGSTPTVNLAVNAPSATSSATPAAKPGAPSNGTGMAPSVTPAAAVQSIAQGYFNALPSVALNQALLVLCVTNSDTVTRAAEKIPFLTENCPGLIFNAQRDGLVLAKLILQNAKPNPLQK